MDKFRRFGLRTPIRNLERAVGRTALRRMSEYLRCYLVQSSRDGAIITLGKRYEKQHVWRH